MNRPRGRQTRLGSLLAVALGALAIFVLPGLASARDGSDHSSSSSSATIKSFDQATKALVVALPDDQTVSGLVTRRTKIRCEDQRGRRGGHDIRGREAEPGDDHGGHGNEPGDDNGSGANCTTADLVPGAAVEEIELRFRGAAVVFDEIELDD